MKLILLISTIAFGICSADYSKPQLAVFMDVIKQCYKQLDVPFDSDLAERVIYNKGFSDDLTTKKFIYCFLAGLDLWESEGVIDRNKAVAFFAPHYDTEQVRALVNKCFRPMGATPEDKAYTYLRCVFKNKTFDI